MELTEQHADEAIANFNAKTYGKRISVPRNHTGDVNANAGWVVKFEKGVGGLWAYLDIIDERTLEDLEKGLIGDVSMGFDWNYQDQKSGMKHGFCIGHIALVTDPYLNDMDDFQKTDKAELSRRYDALAENLGVSNKSGLILMSKNNVEELKRMKFAKVTNDKDFAVEVSYKDAEGNEVKQTAQPGAELEVPAEAEEAVKSQVAGATAAVTDPPEVEPSSTPAADPKETPDDADPTPTGDDPVETTTEDEKKELARLRGERAEWEAEKEYQSLLSKGKIVPAQKELFLGLSKAAAQAKVTLSATVPGITLAKGQALTVPTMLSAILNAGPKTIKLGEQGGEGEATVELTKDQEEKIKKYGFSVEKFKKQLAAGTITMNEIEEK